MYIYPQALRPTSATSLHTKSQTQHNTNPNSKSKSSPNTQTKTKNQVRQDLDLSEMSANDQGNTQQPEAGPQQQQQQQQPQPQQPQNTPVPSIEPTQWPITAPYGTVTWINEDDFYNYVVAKIRSEPNKIQTISDHLPYGTDEEKHHIDEAIINRMEQDQSHGIVWWYDHNHNDGNDNVDEKRYPVRQADGSFRDETIDEVVGGMVAERITTLEIRGSVDEQRAFFAVVRQRIANIEVVNGVDVQQKGVVKFNEPWRHAAMANLDEIEAMFENMQINNMQPAPEGNDIADAMDKMDVETNGGDAEMDG